MGSGSASVSLTSPMASTESSPAPTAGSGTPAKIDVVEVEDDDDVPPSKRHKNLTSDVWTGGHYNLYDVVEEVDGKKVKVQWASCKRCIYKNPRDSRNGTLVFRSHLKTHDVVTGQQQLKLEKKAGETVAAPTPYKYDKEVSLRLSSWWKINGSSYPVLSLLARDILAMQASTIASESAFSSRGRVVHSFRSRLDPEIVEGLICTKDWVGASRKDKKRKVASILKDLEVAEMVAASITMEDLEEQEKQMSSDDED